MDSCCKRQITTFYYDLDWGINIYFLYYVSKSNVMVWAALYHQYVYITTSFQEYPLFRRSLRRGLDLVIWASQRYWRHACWTWPSFCFIWPPFRFSVVLNMFFCNRCWRRTCWTKPTRQSERELLTWATHSW